jgi:hypothetical protein
VPAFGNDGQGAGHILPRPQGELLKILSGRFDPCNRPGLARHPLNVVIFANTTDSASWSKLENYDHDRLAYPASAALPVKG